jgi:hypothetical protein
VKCSDVRSSHLRSGQTPSRKERLFECYAANLSALLPEHTDAFACPVCLRVLDRKALAMGEITEEHVVPRSLGGQIVTLTCRDCNSTAGHRLESHLVRRLQQEDFIAGTSVKPLRVRASIGDGEIAGEAYRHPDRIELHGNPAISNPKLHALAVSSLKGGDIPPEVTLRLPVAFKGLPSWIAVLRMGYLLAFCYFGYEYILHPCVQQVREQIQRPEQQAIPSRAVGRLGEARHENSMLGLLYAPSRLRCFFAVLRLATSVVRYLGVVLPGLATSSEEVYQQWGAVPSPIGDLSFKALFIPFDPDFVCGAESVGFAGWLWREMRKPLATWAWKSEFYYDGSVQTGTEIWYGTKPHSTEMTPQEYERLLEHFGGRTIPLGTSRRPPADSMGAWLQEHVTKRAIASYVGPILVHEGYAERVPWDSTKIRVK